MQEINSPQFQVKLSSKLSSSSLELDNKDIKQTKQKHRSHQSNSDQENQNPNTKENPQKSIFSQYKTIFKAFKSNQYSIQILNSAIEHLQKEYVKKDEIFNSKTKQIQKLKKANQKTLEAIKGEKYRTQKLRQGNSSNVNQLQEVQKELKTTFEQRLKTQQHKNQIYQHFKDLEEEYANKINQLQNFIISHKTQPDSPTKRQSSTVKSPKLSPKQAFQEIKQQNQTYLPQAIQKNHKQIEQLQSKLQSHLQNRQKIKTTIHRVTEKIKSFQHEQYQHQINIQKLQKLKSSLSKNQTQLDQKNSYLNHLFAQVVQLRNQLDEKCEEKYGLVKYFKEVEKEQKNLRKLRKVQVQCAKEQENYRKQKSQQKVQHFSVIQRFSDQRFPESLSKKQQISEKQLPIESPQFNMKNESEKSEEIQRFDTQTRERLGNIIQKYENIKSRRRV